MTELLRKIFAQSQISNSQISHKIKKAQARAHELTWEHASKDILDIVQSAQRIGHVKHKHIGVISPRHSQDGIAEDNKFLYDCISSNFKSVTFYANKDIADRVAPDEENVIRLWNTGDTDFATTVHHIRKSKIDIAHIEYHSGAYYPVEGLDNLIQQLTAAGVQVLVELHAVRGERFDIIASSHNLSKAYKVIIHNKKDYEYALQTLDNVVLISLGEKHYAQRSKLKVKRDLGLDTFDTIIATHGLLNKNKNVDKVIEGFAQFQQKFPNSLFLGVSAVSPNNIHSASELKKVQEVIAQHKLEDHVVMITDFLDRDELEIYLQASDVIVLAYSDAGESASGAVRTCLASDNPVITSSISQFQDVSDATHQIKNISPQEIANAITTMVEDSQYRTQLEKAGQEYLSKKWFEWKGLEILQLIK